ncbi:MAG: hypothetical protein KAR39_12305 [Thermoplasmata archaeon]|nr:hypothetical protein [Thermoplasmata archaeon]
MQLSSITWKYVDERAEHFTGRSWVFDKIRDFLAGPKGIFVVIGDPGTGKTAIAARLIQASTSQSRRGPHPTKADPPEELPVPADTIHAAYFCRKGVVDLLDCAQRLSDQLVDTVPGFEEVLRSHLGSEIKISNVNVQTGDVESGALVAGIRIVLSSLGPERAFTEGIATPLRRLRELGYEAPIVLLIDGLDEALHSKVSSQLPELIADIEHVHLILTTRPDRGVLVLLKDRAQMVDLILNSPPDVDDVAGYCLRRFSHIRSEEARMTLARRIADDDEARGIFLYAYHIVEDLIDKGLSAQISREDAAKIPLPKGGLAGVYREFLRRDLGQDSDEWRTRFSPVLATLVVAQGEKGFDNQQLVATASTLGSRTYSRTDIRNITKDMSQFLHGEHPDGPFRLYHQSFAEFLVDPEQNQDFVIDAAEAHRTIADYYWQKYHKDWQCCDEYGLNNLAVHFAEGDDKNGLYNLIGRYWMEARYVRSGSSYEGFQADVTLAIEVAGAQEPPDLIQEFRCCLICATLVSRATGVPPEALGALAHVGQLKKAIGLASLMQDGDERGKAYQKITDALLVQKQYDDIASLVEQVSLAAQTTKFVSTKVRFQTWAAQVLAKIGEREGADASISLALQIIETTEHRTEKLNALTYVAQALAEMGDEEKLIDVGIHILFVMDSPLLEKATGYRIAEVEALTGLSEALATVGKPDEAYAVAGSITDREAGASALCKVARALIRADKTEEAARIVDQLSQIGELSGRVSAETLSELAHTLFRAGQNEKAITIACRALEAAMEMGPGWLGWFAITKAVPALAITGQIEQARAAAESIEEEHIRSMVLIELVETLAMVGDLDRAEEVAEAFRYLPEKAYALSKLAFALGTKSHKDRAADMVNRVLAFAETGVNDFNKVSFLLGMALAFYQSGSRDEALAAANRALAVAEWRKEEMVTNVRMLTEVAQVLTQIGDNDRGLEVAERCLAVIGNKSGYVNDLSKLALVVERAGRREMAEVLVNRALVEITEIDYVYPKGLGLSRLAQTLSHFENREKAREIARLALTSAEDISDVSDQAFVLSELALAFAQIDDLDRASELVSRILEQEQAWRGETSSYVLGPLAFTLVKLGDRARLDRALKAAEDVGEEQHWMRDSVIKEVILPLAQAGRFEKAIKVANSITDLDKRACALADVSQALVQAERQQQGLEVARLAMKTARFAGLGTLLDVLRVVATAIATVENGRTLWEAFESMSEIEGWWDKH